MMGPIHDERGLEQGGINSSDFYKIFGKKQLSMAQNSSLDVKFGEHVVDDRGTDARRTVEDITVAQDYRLGNRKFREVTDQEMLISSLTSSTLLHRCPDVSNSCQDQFKLQFIIPEEKPSSQLKTAKSNLNNSISLSNTEAQALHGEVIQKAVFF